MSCEIILQIFSGGFLSEPVSYQAVERKLDSVLDRLPVRTVIMGWARDKALYEKTAQYLAKRNVEFYFWFPVFSETGSVRSQSGLEDFLLRRQKAGGENGSHTEEDFSFCCPNDPQNIENILDLFQREFSSIPFTGVFLDKIRFPSFAQGSGQGLQSGFGSVFSCFCPNCLELYKKENFDNEELKDSLFRPSTAPLGIKKYRGNGVYDFEDPRIAKFFSIKAAFIYNRLELLSNYFRGKGYGIGFDVFAPFLSAFVGQDLKVLSGLCDFMKPMMYRATNAPAGLPFETEMLLRETVGNDIGKRNAFYKVMDLDGEKKPFDLDFAAKELKKLAAVSACPVYAGMEINRKKNLAEVYPDYIEETITAYAPTGVRGFALSWNLLDAPEENIAKVIDVIS